MSEPKIQAFGVADDKVVGSAWSWAGGWTGSLLLHAALLSLAAWFLGTVHLVPEPRLPHWEVDLVEPPQPPTTGPSENRPIERTPDILERLEPVVQERPVHIIDRGPKDAKRLPQTRVVRKTPSVLTRDTASSVTVRRDAHRASRETRIPRSAPSPVVIQRDPSVPVGTRAGNPSLIATAKRADAGQVVESRSTAPRPERVQTAGAAPPVVPTMSSSDEVITSISSSAVEERAPHRTVAERGRGEIESPPTSLREVVDTIREAAPLETTNEIPDIRTITKSMASVRDRSDAIRTVTARAAVTRPDYGWLAHALYERVAAEKRYPSAARADNLEGKVIVRAVIRQDGHLADLSVQQSSGHEILDQDAIELIQRVCPLPITQPLGQPSVALDVPISYHLH